MFTIYIPEDTLKKICIEEMGKEPSDQSIWFKIFCKQSEISVSSFNESDEWDEDDPLFIFSQSYDVEIPYDTEYIQSIYHDHKQVLKNPCGAYILDISEEDALRIQQQYGVICLSTKSLGDPIICSPPISKAPAEGETGIGWKKVINEFSSSMNFYAEPDALCHLIRKDFNVKEVQVKMKERSGGVSYFTNPFKTIYFMVSVILSILFIQ